MWPFRHRISPHQKEEALSLVFHLQKMLAYQQLAMETVNDSVYTVTGSPTSNELRHASAWLGSPDLVDRYVLPALRQKYRILEKLHEEHKAFGRPAIPKHAELYELFSTFSIVMMERGKLQIQQLTEWVMNPSVEADSSRLDEVESEAMGRLLQGLNNFIRKHGLSNDDFLRINCDVCNSVRQSIGLAPLALGDFTARYFAGMSGIRARFFTDECST